MRGHGSTRGALQSNGRLGTPRGTLRERPLCASTLRVHSPGPLAGPTVRATHRAQFGRPPSEPSPSRSPKAQSMKSVPFPRLDSGWTGGAYSLWRAALGLGLLLHFGLVLLGGSEFFASRGGFPEEASHSLVRFFPTVLGLDDSPAFFGAVVGLGCVASLALLVGWRDRWAAVLLAYLLACLQLRPPLAANPSLLYLTLVLALHALQPAAPFGSLRARGRPSPGGDWSFPPRARALLWILLMAGYAYGGIDKLQSPTWTDGSALRRLLEGPLARDHILRSWLLDAPGVLLSGATLGVLGLELLAAPLALWKPARPYLVVALLGLQLGVALFVDASSLGFAMVLVHLLACDPAWIPGRKEPATVFYDGECGVCHGFVRFLLSEDRFATLRFAPLQSESLVARLGPRAAEELPDSVVVLEGSGAVHLESDGVVAALARLEGIWRIAGALVRAVPRPLRNLGYRGIARVRHRLVRKPPGLCPLMPPEVGARFDP